MPKLVDLDAAADQLGITRRHLFRLIQARSLTKHKRIGDRRIYLEAGELRRLMGPRPVERRES